MNNKLRGASVTLHNLSVTMQELSDEATVNRSHLSRARHLLEAAQENHLGPLNEKIKAFLEETA